MLAAARAARVGLVQKAASASFKVAATQAVRQHTTAALCGETGVCNPCQDCFKVLNIAPVASLSDVAEAYHRQALRWLPEYDLEDPEAAEETFEKVLGAYKMLSRHMEAGSKVTGG
mmetsp:Transcript_13404/g.31813  ORF Transcript_13404/g.31813 Transcript_13404/m.31813 type:complete len:116 (+) Transcript_13404:47-394(+)